MSDTTAVIRLYFSLRTRQPSAHLREAPILMVCPACGYVPHEARQYYGSRYGHVGNFTCGRCGAKVTITDGDCFPPVRYIATGARGQSSESFVFEELYRVNWTDLKQAEALTGAVIVPPGEQGEVDFQAALHVLEATVSQSGLPRLTAPLPTGIPWVPAPFRAWLDALSTLEGTGVR